MTLFSLLIVAILDNDMSIMISITIQVLHVLHCTAGCFFFSLVKPMVKQTVPFEGRSAEDVGA